MDLSRLHVLTMISNPCRYQSRYRLHREFEARLKRAGVQLWTHEVAYGHRHFHVTERDNPHHLQTRTTHELWIKERALKLLVNRLTERHPDWQYVVWCDADVEFPNWEGDDSWLARTWHQLQHHRVVQCFQTAVDLGPHGQALHTHTGFGYSHVSGRAFKHGYVDWHPGFCWAMRRDAYDHTPFIDIGILGSGDRHMACGWIGKIDQSVNHKVSPGYWQHLLTWQRQAERYIRHDVGYVPGTLLHHFHGAKVNRQYANRWKILVDTQYDPCTDIKEDAYGLWQLVDHGDRRSIRLRDKLRAYFRLRDEDSTWIG